MKDRLKSHYGSSGHVTSFPGKHSVFCFKGHADNFIYQKWAEERKPPEDMRCQVVKQAAKILREEIRSKAFDMESYFCGAEMNEEYLVPDLLRTFLTELIKHKSNQAQRTVEALAQAIMQACRPRSFISPILLAIGVYIHRHIGSRLVIDILHSLGYSASYGEVQIFLLSAATAGLPPQDANFGAFQQFVFDNADYNVRTIDGYNTLHNMGAIRATTPAASSSLPYSIPRLRQNKGVQELTSGRMKIVHYCKPATPGLKSVTVRELAYLKRSVTWELALRLDYMWMSSYTVKPYLTPRPSWNGYMQVNYRVSVLYAGRIFWLYCTARGVLVDDILAWGP